MDGRERCWQCDGQGFVIWRDGVALPSYAENAPQDTEPCPTCNKDPQRTKCGLSSEQIEEATIFGSTIDGMREDQRKQGMNNIEASPNDPSHNEDPECI